MLLDDHPTTVARLFEEFASYYVACGQHARARELRQIFGKHVLAFIGEMDPVLVDHGLLSSLVDNVKERVGAASAFNLRASLITFFNWCVRKGELPASPASHLAPVRRPDKCQELGLDELAVIWRACDFARIVSETPPPAVARALSWACYYRLMLMLGESRRRLVAVRWPDLDLTRAVWRIVPDGSKALQLRPLAQGTVALLHTFRDHMAAFRQIGTGDLVLTNAKGETLGDFRRARLWLDGKTLPLSPQMASWTEYDVRRSVQQGLALGGARSRTVGSSGASEFRSLCFEDSANWAKARAGAELWTARLLNSAG